MKMRKKTIVLLGLAIIIFIILVRFDLTSNWLLFVSLLGVMLPAVAEFTKGSATKNIRLIGHCTMILGLLLSLVTTLIDDDYRKNVSQLFEDTKRSIEELRKSKGDNTKWPLPELVSGEPNRPVELSKIIDQLPRPDNLWQNKVIEQRYIPEGDLDESSMSNEFEDNNASDRNVNDSVRDNHRKRFYGGESIEEVTDNYGKDRTRKAIKGKAGDKYFNSETLECDGAKLFAYVNEKRSIFVSFRGLNKYDLNWVFRRVGDLEVERITFEPRGGGIRIVNISSNKQLWEFIDIREGDIVYRVNEFTIDDTAYATLAYRIASAAMKMWEKDISEIRVDLYRNETAISKLFIDRQK